MNWKQLLIGEYEHIESDEYNEFDEGLKRTKISLSIGLIPGIGIITLIYGVYRLFQ